MTKILRTQWKKAESPDQKRECFDNSPIFLSRSFSFVYNFLKISLSLYQMVHKRVRKSKPKMLRFKPETVVPLTTEISELLGELFVREAGRVAHHHLLQLLERRVPLVVGKLSGRQLDLKRKYASLFTRSEDKMFYTLPLLHKVDAFRRELVVGEGWGGVVDDLFQ